MSELRQRALGCLLAGALGDAIGRPYENAVPGVSVVVPLTLTVTDDTQLTLATCEAIVAAGGRVDPQRIAGAFAAGFRASAYRGLGASTAKALSELSHGGHWALVGRKGEHAAGNGAAMRIAPLAFVLDPRELELRTAYRDVCRITHHNDEAYVAALAVAVAVRLAFEGAWSGGADLLEQITPHLPDSRVRDRLEELTPLRTALSLGEIAGRWGTSGYAVESVPLALCGAERTSSEGIPDLLLELASCGGDTDTTGSIAGQIAGAYLGAVALDPELVARLEPKIRPAAERFADLVAQ